MASRGATGSGRACAPPPATRGPGVTGCRTGTAWRPTGTEVSGVAGGSAAPRAGRWGRALPLTAGPRGGREAHVSGNPPKHLGEPPTLLPRPLSPGGGVRTRRVRGGLDLTRFWGRRCVQTGGNEARRHLAGASAALPPGGSAPGMAGLGRERCHLSPSHYVPDPSLSRPGLKSPLPWSERAPWAWRLAVAAHRCRDWFHVESYFASGPLVA